MSVTTLTAVGHVDGLTSGYKRSFNAIGPVASGELKRPASLPASALRNDRGTNATLPIARCTSIPVFPGEVAFVRTGKGLTKLGDGSTFLPIVTLSQINEMLLDNPVAMVGNPRSLNLLTPKKSKRVWHRNNKGKTVPLEYSEFDPTKMTDDLSHPLHAYALDGVVCSASDARGGQGDRHGYNTREEAAGCNVAVGGRSPLVAVSMKGQAVRMTARVFVVLVANRVTRGAARPRRDTPHTPFFTGATMDQSSLFSTAVKNKSKKAAAAAKARTQEWVFQYELVTSAELDIEWKFRKFKVEEISNNDAIRVPVKMWQLGSVTDLNSGHQGLPTQFTITVNVRPFHGVETRKLTTVDGQKIWVKLPPGRTGPQSVFFPPERDEQRILKSNYFHSVNKHFMHKRGHRTCFDRGMAKSCGFPTSAATSAGPSAEEFAEFQKAMQQQQAAFITKTLGQLAEAERQLAAAQASAEAANEAAQALRNSITKGDTLEQVNKRIKTVEEHVDKHETDIEYVDEVINGLLKANETTDNRLNAMGEKITNNSGNVQTAIENLRTEVNKAVNGATESMNVKSGELEEMVSANGKRADSLQKDIQVFKQEIVASQESHQQREAENGRVVQSQLAAYLDKVKVTLANFETANVEKFEELKAAVKGVVTKTAELAENSSREQASATALEERIVQLSASKATKTELKEVSEQIKATEQLLASTREQTTEISEKVQQANTSVNSVIDASKAANELNGKANALNAAVNDNLNKTRNLLSTTQEELATVKSLIAELKEKAAERAALFRTHRDFINKQEKEIDAELKKQAAEVKKKAAADAAVYRTQRDFLNKQEKAVLEESRS